MTAGRGFRRERHHLEGVGAWRRQPREAEEAEEEAEEPPHAPAEAGEAGEAAVVGLPAGDPLGRRAAYRLPGG
jgi:hypothetical protein